MGNTYPCIPLRAINISVWFWIVARTSSN